MAEKERDKDIFATINQYSQRHWLCIFCKFLSCYHCLLPLLRQRTELNAQHEADSKCFSGAVCSKAGVRIAPASFLHGQKWRLCSVVSYFSSGRHTLQLIQVRCIKNGNDTATHRWIREKLLFIEIKHIFSQTCSVLCCSYRISFLTCKHWHNRTEL